MSDIVRPSSGNPRTERMVINSQRHCLESRTGVTRSIYFSRRHLKSVNYNLHTQPFGLAESIYSIYLLYALFVSDVRSGIISNTEKGIPFKHRSGCRVEIRVFKFQMLGLLFSKIVIVMEKIRLEFRTLSNYILINNEF